MTTAITTDRELLEMAAKAAGIEITWENSHPDPERLEDFMGLNNYFPWNPLAYDGDALRLAVALDLCVTPYPIYTKPKHSVLVQLKNMDDSRFEVMEMSGSDPCAATRRAIVRAAAAIGATK